MLHEKLVKIGAKVVRHGGYVTFQLAEVAVPRHLYGTPLPGSSQFALTTPTTVIRFHFKFR